MLSPGDQVAGPEDDTLPYMDHSDEQAFVSTAVLWVYTVYALFYFLLHPVLKMNQSYT